MTCVSYMREQRAQEIVIGVISDTHGLMRPEAIGALRGSDMIIHAGDVGKAEVLDGLSGIAPTVAVRGNIDKANWAASLQATETVEVGDLRLLVLHDIAQLDVDPGTSSFAAVVFGHSHVPSVETRNGVLFFNPGSAGPRRFKLPVTVARIRVAGRRLRPEILQLEV